MSRFQLPFAVLALAAVASPASAAQTNAVTTVNVVKPVSLSKLQDLDFGTLTFAGEGAHLVNHAFASDGIQLDPTKPESLVMSTDGTTVAAAMFVREAVGDPGPLPAGCLALWHAHDNLCYSGPPNEGGTVNWLVDMGGCPSGSIRETSAVIMAGSR